MENIYTKVYSLKEADDLGHFIMSMGYEGVQNDSYRYCREAMAWAFKENNRHHRDYIYVGVGTYSLMVSNNKRWLNRRNCTFIEDVKVFKRKVTNRFRERIKEIEKREKAKNIEDALNVFEDTLRNHEHYAKYQISEQENMCRVAQVLKPDVLKVIVDALKRKLTKIENNYGN